MCHAFTHSRIHALGFARKSLQTSHFCADFRLFVQKELTFPKERGFAECPKRAAEISAEAHIHHGRPDSAIDDVGDMTARFRPPALAR